MSTYRRADHSPDDQRWLGQWRPHFRQAAAVLVAVRAEQLAPVPVPAVLAEAAARGVGAKAGVGRAAAAQRETVGPIEAVLALQALPSDVVAVVTQRAVALVLAVLQGALHHATTAIRSS